MSTPTLSRRLVAEGIGTAFLLAVVVGSGIMAERLTQDTALALLANTLATGAGLVALILAFGDLSGAHFNPAVTVALAVRRRHAWREVPSYVLVQLVGAYLGVAAAHVMFAERLVQASTHTRASAGEIVAEVIATFGLVGVIFGCLRRKAEYVAFAVGAYITAAYWFTSSTSFANPAVTLARAATNTFSGIRPIDAPAFVLAQLLGAVLAAGLFGWLDTEEP
jgi:glycerol uptake facilitator-like aquaporin